MLISSPQHGVNMNTSLTTFDGFPRADIDVAQSTLTSGARRLHLTGHGSSDNAGADSAAEE